MHRTRLFFLTFLLLLGSCDHLTRVHRSVEVPPDLTFTGCIRKAAEKVGYSANAFHYVYGEKNSPEVLDKFGLAEASGVQLDEGIYPLSKDFSVAHERCVTGKTYLGGQYSAINGVGESEAISRLDAILNEALTMCKKPELKSKIHSSYSMCDTSAPKRQ